MEKDGRYAEVIVDLPVAQVDKIYHYSVPECLVDDIIIGSKVVVPFGRRKIVGYVVGFSDVPETESVKEIEDILDPGPLFNSEQLDMARWLAGYYMCPLVKALQVVVGPRLHPTSPPRKRFIRPNFSPHQLDQIIQELGKRAGKRAAVLRAVMAYPGLTRKELAEVAGCSESVIDALIKDNYLVVESREERRNPYPEPGIRREPVTLTAEQAAALKRVTGALAAGRPDVFLLHGVTGSGKTEVYVRSVEKAISLGKQAIVLVPDIALTPQMIAVFKGRFGDRVAVLHSRLSDGERYDEWLRIEQGLASVVLGVRSAIFAPLQKLGLIVIDEEQEPSYKQEESPRYNARAVALYRARRCGAVVLLGSATPSLETYTRARGGGSVFQLLTLQQRVESRPLPRVFVVDLREELRRGNHGLFSHLLLEKMKRRLELGQQVVLFLNRRGFNTLVACRECGLVLKCPHCDISLTYHINGRVICHYCNHSVPAPGLCPACGGGYLGFWGVGTQRVEEEVRRLFPEARVLRMDADTTVRKNSHRRILDAFASGKADILLGTQMVAKGLDLPLVTLVGVINADISLHMPDFRSSERTFQLLMQVAGRSGRGQTPGEVVIQTYSPSHYAVIAAARCDYGEFYRREMAVRRELGYPPFSRMIRVLITGTREEEVMREAVQLEDRFKKYKDEEVFLVGPAPAPIGKIKGRYRWHLVLWGRELRRVREVVQSVLNEYRSGSSKRGIIVTVDVDPLSLI